MTVNNPKIDSVVRGFYRSALSDASHYEVGINVFGGAFASPLALLRDGALDSNIAQMQRWCKEHGVEIAPHGKTTLTPGIFARQLEAGAWGLTVASPAQARVALAAGAKRILIANEVTDRAGIEWIGITLAEDPSLQIFCYVDSLAGVNSLATQLSSTLPVGRQLGVLVELGVAGGRTGLRNDDEALQVAHAVTTSPQLRLDGVAGYEGVAGGKADAIGVDAVEKFCTRLRDFAERLNSEGLLHATENLPVIISAGGSVFFDQVARVLRSALGEQKDTLVLLRSGCYVTHDHGLYSRLTPASRGGDGPGLVPALEVWGRVLSIPEPGRAIVDVGRRDVSYDIEMPKVLSRKESGGGPSTDLIATVLELNDQHAFLNLAPATVLQIGDWVGFGISHPCTTFDKWNTLLLIDDYDGLVDKLHTFF